jgi:hypothetical protein
MKTIISLDHGHCLSCQIPVVWWHASWLGQGYLSTPIKDSRSRRVPISVHASWNLTLNPSIGGQEKGSRRGPSARSESCTSNIFSVVHEQNCLSSVLPLNRQRDSGGRTRQLPGPSTREPIGRLLKRGAD